MEKILTFCFGLIIGSFLNVLIFRSRTGESVFLSRSHCQKCNQKLVARDLIPVVSFIFYRGRCRYCHENISWVYPVVELACGVLFLMLYSKYQHLMFLWDLKRVYGLSGRTSRPFFLLPFRDAFFICSMIIVFMYDYLYYLILDSLVLPMIVIAFSLNFLMGKDPKDMLLAGVVLSSFFLLQYIISHGKWVGGGDIRLAFLVGVILSWPNALDALFASYILGAIVALILLLTRKMKWHSALPYGTFLATTTIYNVLYGPIFLDWYMKILGV